MIFVPEKLGDTFEKVAHHSTNVQIYNLRAAVPTC